MTPSRASLIVIFLVRGAIGRARRSLKNAARIALRRAPHQRDNRANALLLRHLRGRQKIAGITYTGGAGEGAGAQALSIFYARNFARATGIAYVHTPFTVIAHADRPMADWARIWEQTFNLGDGAPPAGAAGGPLLDLNQLYAADGYDPIFMKHLTQAFALTRQDLRARYRPAGAAAADQPAAAERPLRIAVHVRRGDVSPERNASMWTDLAIVARTLAQVRGHLSQRRLAHRVRIVSQGRPGDFAALAGDGVDFMLDQDAVRSFDELVRADILIMAKSTYSHVAAILSHGIKLYTPNFTSPLPEWLTLRPDGSCDDAEFVRQLDQLPHVHSGAAARADGV